MQSTGTAAFAIHGELMLNAGRPLVNKPFVPCGLVNLWKKKVDALTPIRSVLCRIRMCGAECATHLTSAKDRSDRRGAV